MTWIKGGKRYGCVLCATVLCCVILGTGCAGNRGSGGQENGTENGQRLVEAEPAGGQKSGNGTESVGEQKPESGTETAEASNPAAGIKAVETSDTTEAELIEENPVSFVNPPSLSLAELYLSSFNEFSVTSGSYQWSYREDGETVSVVACGSHPLDAPNGCEIEIFEVPYFERMDAVPYAMIWRISPSATLGTAPEQLVVREWDISQMGNTEAEPETKSNIRRSTGGKTDTVELKRDKVYEITAVWEDSQLETRGYAGKVSFVLVTGELRYEQDGKDYEKVRDLTDGSYRWASVVEKAETIRDGQGKEAVDYNSQSREFVRLDGSRTLEVRRWDNLLYTAGEYLIYEYDGTVHVAKPDQLYQPVLSYEVGATHGIVTKVPDGYMVADEKAFTVTWYDEDFKLTKQLTGYRAGESGRYYEDGRMAVRDMDTGLMGFLDESGELVIPCKYNLVHDFANGYASVLVDAEVIPYTEDGGTVPMFDASGGQWGILDTRGTFVLEPSERFANRSDKDPELVYSGGVRCFSDVRKDGSVDFLARDEGDRVVETVRIAGEEVR
ncbi:MAG: WG repeat-containing protein [Eubacteriales bacterium]|nr:WG repeat-containing protein [Eubacteriales bacterium]